MVEIRTDCYLAKLRTFQYIYKKAHFEYITRTAGSPLSPSWDLLTRLKNKEISFNEYLEFLKCEIYNNPKAIQRLRQLANLSKTKTIFLVCYERNPKECHRTLIKELIEQEISNLANGNKICGLVLFR